MNDTFKKVLFVLGSLLFLLLLAGNLFYHNDNRALLNKNKDLIKESKSLLENIDILQKDKLSLLEQLAKKEVEIVYKEKVIYKDKNVLIIPEDYNELKNNHILLSSLYLEKGKMYDILKKQAEDDYKTIEELKNKLKELMDMNTELAYQLEHPKVPFFKQYIKGGVGYSLQYGSNYQIGYQIQLMDRFTLESIIHYPDPSISILIGIKLNG